MHSVNVDKNEKTLHRHRRIRRLKKLLRFLPRKATLHRYPFLKYFAKSIRKRAYLWSFRVKDVAPAFYAGWILTLLPVIGFHTIGAFLLSFVLRTNIMILVGLQAISNPFTLAPLWAFEYYVGRFILKVIHCEHFFQHGFQDAGVSLTHKGKAALDIFLTISVGGIVCGVLFAFLSMLIYKMAAKRASQHRLHS